MFHWPFGSALKKGLCAETRLLCMPKNMPRLQIRGQMHLIHTNQQFRPLPKSKRPEQPIFQAQNTHTNAAISLKTHSLSNNYVAIKFISHIIFR